MRRFLQKPEWLIFLVSLWLVLGCNTAYWRLVAENAPPGASASTLFLVCFALLSTGLTALALLIFALGPATRVVLSLALLVAAATGYFSAHLGMLFDAGMLVNVIETNRGEAFELVTPALLGNVVVWGLLPAILVWLYPLSPRRAGNAVLSRGVAMVVAFVLVAAPVFAMQKEIFSVIRNNRELGHLITPLNVVSASFVVAKDALETPASYEQIALDATLAAPATQNDLPNVHVLIIGETARAANFSLNGYPSQTNPQLGQRRDIHFLEAASCGTATAVSLPCMFSLQKRGNFDRDESASQDNLLDLAARAGYDVYWVDNGNGCKGICARAMSSDVHFSDVASVCEDGECYDEILVHELERILPTISKDTLIVLHQLGSHGPAYFRRYPEPFRSFRPDCRSPNLGECSRDKILNAYDNTILYTDHVIASAIEVLSGYSATIDASLVYMSDHGESLGERGLYLHGMPYGLAPDEQREIPFITWIGASTMAEQQIPAACAPQAAGTVSHDNLFHTELGLLGVATHVYDPDMDVYSSCRMDYSADTARPRAHSRREAIFSLIVTDSG